MKSLNEQINEIVKSRKSMAAKRYDLVKLGLQPHEVYAILHPLPAYCKGFDADGLTFGVEIECYNADRMRLISEATSRGLTMHSEGYNHVDNNHYYKLVSDASISGYNGVECVSPILKGRDGHNSLKACCEALNATGARVNQSTGLHVHFGAANITEAHFCNIVRNYQRLEAVIDTFMPVSRRASNNRYCCTLCNIDMTGVNTIAGAQRAMHYDRYYKVNVTAYNSHKTIEFRQHAGTTNYTKIKNWLQFLRKLIAWSYNNTIDTCNSIAEIPFLNDTEKAYFTARAAELN